MTVKTVEVFVKSAMSSAFSEKLGVVGLTGFLSVVVGNSLL